MVNRASDTITLGINANDVGTYTLLGGQVIVGNELRVGERGVGTFNHSGGSVNAPALLLAGSGSGDGTYTLSDTATLTTTVSVVGHAGLGRFIQLGGTHVMTSLLHVASLGGRGTYQLVGGTLQAPSLSLGSTTTEGTFEQSGGTARFSGSVLILGNRGLYAQSGGLLEAATIQNDAVFTQSGGTVTATQFNNFGGLSVGGEFTAKLLNQGTLVLNGGRLSVQDNLVNNGTVFGFGTIVGPFAFTNNGLVQQNGTLNLQTTGTNVNAASILLGNGLRFVLAGANPNLTNQGTLNLSGAIVTGGTLNNTGFGTIAGPGTVLSTLVNDGLLLVPFGSTFVQSTFTNRGVVQLDGVGASLTGAGLTNLGTVQGAGQVAGLIVNRGTIEPVGGTLVFSTGTLANIVDPPTGLPAVVSVPADTKLLLSKGFGVQTAVISMGGGTLDTNNTPLNNQGQITGHGTLRTGGLTNNGSITLTGGPTTVNGPVTNAAGRVLRIQNAPAVFTGLVTNNGSLEILNTSAVFAGGFTGAAAAASASALPGGVDGTGALVVNAAAHVDASYVRQESLAVAGSVAIRQRAGGGDDSALAFLQIDGAGTLDLADTTLVIDYPAADSPLASVLGRLAAAYDRGRWDRPGITSSAAAADPSRATTLGYRDDGAMLTVMFTWRGDANLDGVVNAADRAALIAGTQRAPGTAHWTDGDFNYDRTVNADDLLLLALGASFSGGAHIGVTVPEPATLAVPCATLLRALRGRRLRRHN
jgi:hypothetical protein